MKNWFKKNGKWLIAPAIMGISFIVSCFFSFPIVFGQSMENNFHDGDLLFMNKTRYSSVEDIKRFDVVVVKNDEGTFIIKRVIGLPGETLKITDGETYVNGVLLNDPYKKELTEDAGVLKEELTIPSDCIFVMGDNRNNSRDSRVIGPISFQDVSGKCESFLFNLHGDDQTTGEGL